ncbi:MAG TPA: hypothetical protein PLI19_03090, partial [Erysipelotrichaceae bacterium]|nr:hypothetical protein [Erysipelotrichaceae bacterium]
MKYLNRKSNYDKYPEKIISGFDQSVWAGYADICSILKKELKDKSILTIETYPGVIDSEVLAEISQRIKAKRIIQSTDIFIASSKMDEM